MKTIGDLNCLGRSLRRGVGVGIGAVPCDHFNAGMTSKPFDHCLDGLIRQQLNRLPGFQVIEQSAIGVAFLFNTQ